VNILVTGSSGFLGRNLVENLKHSGYNVMEYDICNDISELRSLVTSADIIFHFAGVNRPKTKDEFDIGNRELTQIISDIVIANNCSPKIVYSSSQKVNLMVEGTLQRDTLNYEYAQSKLGAERVLLDLRDKSETEVFIFRFPNIFGKWCEPNYNSVVATFMNNIAHDLPILISDENSNVDLIYVDDIVKSCQLIIENKLPIKTDSYYVISQTFSLTLGELAEKIESFSKLRRTLHVPNQTKLLDKYLYSTFLSYLPTEKWSYTLDKKSDERGWFAEFIHTEVFGQVAISTTKPGISRGNHWHNTKIEKFLVVSGSGQVLLRKVTDNGLQPDIISIDTNESNGKVIEIPPGYVHSIVNTGEIDMVLLIWGSELFDPKNPDTFWESI
jgi:UDP-2-acetamido-2,6-beta-L-arabino-hexul-4-ose reductase